MLCAQAAPFEQELGRVQFHESDAELPEVYRKNRLRCREFALALRKATTRRQLLSSFRIDSDSNQLGSHKDLRCCRRERSGRLLDQETLLGRYLLKRRRFVFRTML